MKRLLLLTVIFAVAVTVLIAGSGTAAAQPSDACGTEQFDVPDSGSYFDFTEACINHDDCVDAAQTAGERSPCDEQFRQDMLASCAEGFPRSDLRYSLCRAQALIYYVGVRIGSLLMLFQRN
jgi:hypothetical protein